MITMTIVQPACQFAAAWAIVVGMTLPLRAGDEPNLPRAFVDGFGYGWTVLKEGDFVAVNGGPDTWTWHGDILKCTGEPVGVIRSREQLTNFELIVRWRHLHSGGNSGIFVWTSPEALRDLPPGKLPPSGIEVQVLDLGYVEEYERTSGQKADWFTTHGDVFPVGSASMKPFSPTSPDGRRSFPRRQLSKGVGLWNDYYIRCINGEVRLWVNGEEVSGGSDCRPRTGYLCLESEGAPIEFTALRIRRLP